METKQQKKARLNRKLRIESLENRRLLAGDVVANAAAMAEPMPGDADLNGRVDFADFVRCAGNFGSTDASWADGDFTGDRSVTFGDFTLLSSNFGKTQSAEGAAEASNESDDASNDVSGIHYSTLLAGEGAVHGEAEYEIEHNGSEREFEVEVESADPNVTYDVSIDGIVVSQVTTDSQGDGRIKLSTSPDADEQQLPEDFPEVTETSSVTVGDVLSGQFNGNVSADDGSQGDDSDDEADEIDELDEADEVDEQDEADDDLDHNDDEDRELEARLSGPGRAHGEAEFESEHGAAEQEFEVEIEGAQPDTTYAVSVDSIFAGSITTDSRGRGKLELSTDPDEGEQLLPTDFPAVGVDSTITIGDLLSGRFTLDD